MRIVFKKRAGLNFRNATAIQVSIIGRDFPSMYLFKEQSRAINALL